MKKVLALVLAVIMVCTMAFAVTVDGVITPGSGTPVTPSGSDYDIVAPGTTYVVNFGTDSNLFTKYYVDPTTNKFVPDKNAVTVSYAAGADLVASAGWVHVTESKDDKTKLGGTSDTGSYMYLITLKNDFTRIADGKSFDFSISSISIKSTGYNPIELFKEDVNAKKVIRADVGIATKDVILTDGATPAEGMINVITKLVKNTKEVASYDAALTMSVTTADTTSVASVTLNKGEKLYYTAATLKNFNAATDKYADGTAYNTTDNAFSVTNPWNKNGVASFAQKENAAKAYNVYAKTMDGKIYQVSATLTDGVLKFSVPALSNVIVTEKVMKTAGTIGTTTGTTPGSTTNPGTGANDVVGVAAALAVVALVSGAAISLKK